MKVGVLALQGSFKEHQQSLEQLGVQASQVRVPTDLDGLTHLILPGGESTTMEQLMSRTGLFDALKKQAPKLVMYGTCAGAILMSTKILDAKSGQRCLGLMDINVRRNAFGRQVDSFETQIFIEGIAHTMPAVFIRAPVITEVGSSVHVLARLPDGTMAAARQGNYLVTTFHPELTHDVSIHRYFLAMGRPNKSM